MLSLSLKSQLLHYFLKKKMFTFVGSNSNSLEHIIKPHVLTVCTSQS